RPTITIAGSPAWPRSRRRCAKSSGSKSDLAMQGWLHRCREAIQNAQERLAAEAKAFLTPGPRMVDEIECVFSLVLAIVLGHLVGAQNISWAAFSGFMVMRGHVSESLRRGLLRIAGTIGGAAIAVAIFPGIAPIPLASSAALALIGWCSLYGALTH